MLNFRGKRSDSNSFAAAITTINLYRIRVFIRRWYGPSINFMVVLKTFYRGDLMAASLPYLASNKNVPLLFEKIAAAKVPDKFTHNFLTTTIGLKGTNDRALIPLLRNMGFIDQSGTPMPSYRLLKGHNRRGTLANGMRHAYAPLFDADQNAQKLSSDRLKSLALLWHILLSLVIFRIPESAFD